MNRSRAFTMVEMLVAVAMLTLIFGAILSFIWNTREQRLRVAEAITDSDVAMAVLDRIESDLMTVVAAAPGAGAGVMGDDRSLKLLFRSVWLAGGTGPEAVRDLQGATYTYDEERMVVHAARWASGMSEPIESDLCSGVVRARFRYHDGLLWQDSFDSVESDRLPRMVEVSLWLARSPAEGDPAWRRLIAVPDADDGGVIGGAS